MIFPRYMLDAPTPTNIFVVNANGAGTELQLTRDDRSTHPIWLPDGKRIIFVRDPERSSGRRSLGNAVELVVMTRDGRNSKQIASFEWGRGETMSLSPDGRTLAIDGEVRSLSGAGVFSFESSIYLLDVEGGGEPRIFLNGGSHPSWSPDGSQIAYTCNKILKSGEYERSVCIVPVADHLEPRVIAGDAWKPSWSPNGERILYTAYKERKSRLIVSKPDGSGVIPLTDWRPEVPSAVWSPDGMQIAFTEFQPMDDEFYHSGPLSSQRVPRIFLNSVDGKRIGPLGERKRLWCGELSWSPDGRSIAAVCTSGLRDAMTGRQRFEATLYVIDVIDLRATPRKIADLGVRRPTFAPAPSY